MNVTWMYNKNAHLWAEIPLGLTSFHFPPFDLCDVAACCLALLIAPLTNAFTNVLDQRTCLLFHIAHTMHF